MEPWMGVVGGLIAAVSGYLIALARNRTDVSLDDRSAYQQAQQDLQAFFRHELDTARQERDEVRIENERLWRELRELVEGAETLKELHETEAHP